MNTAWIAVIGTLGGVAVTAAAGLLTAMVTGRQQQATLERQFQQQTNSKVREERRAIFVE
jgi:gas vesicle protein